MNLMKFYTPWVFIGLTSLTFNAADALQTPAADLIITGGNVVTMDTARPTAQAIAIRNGRILAVGDNDRIRRFANHKTERLELDGEFVMPGFIESHGHFLGLGESMMMLQLGDAKSWDEIVNRVGRAAEMTPAGEWIVGRGWHQAKWNQTPEPSVDGYPYADRLSELTPANPVLLTHASGHMSLANEYAMRLAKIDNETRNPPGGEIVRESSGRAIGVFRETAQSLISRIKARDDANRSAADHLQFSLKAIDLAVAECLRNGVTSFQDAGSSFRQIDYLRSVAEGGSLGVRLWVMVREGNDRLRERLADYRCVGLADDFLTVRAIKLSIDGALGAHGAWLLAPYEDLPTSTGLNTEPLESVLAAAEIAIANDCQLCIHAIGDRANREVLEIYEQSFKKYPHNRSRRWRIEHAQHLHPDDIPRFGRLGVIASMQGVHCTSDAIFVPKRLGMKRAHEGAYVWQSLLETGAIIANGSDVPVEPINPIESFYASVTRRINTDLTFNPQQAMTRMQALRSYTLDAAYAAFEENTKGSLVPGKLADITILSNDLLNCPESEIRQSSVLYTVVAGKIVYRLKE